MNKYDSKKLGENIRKVRIAKGYSQERLAGNSGLHWTYIGQIERGERPYFSVSTLVKICNGLEVKPDKILGYELIKTTKTREGEELMSAYAFFEKSPKTAEDLAILVNRIIRLTKNQKSKT